MIVLRTAEELAARLNALNDDYCLLVGAGMSLPSGLPTAIPLMHAIVDALPIQSLDKQRLHGTLSSDRADAVNVYDFIRFEQMVAALSLTVDPQLSTFDVLHTIGAPNYYHMAIARLIQRGIPVMTTNFDTLIERACLNIGLDLIVCKTEADYQEISKGDRPKHVLMKLHGSFPTSREQASPFSASIDSVTSQLREFPEKWKYVESIATKNPLVILGYSGGDDFDVMPSIFYNNSSKPVLWVNHDTQGNGVLSDHLQWFLGRLPGRLLDQTRSSERGEAAIAVWIGDTRLALFALLNRGASRQDMDGPTVDSAVALDTFKKALSKMFENERRLCLLFVAYLFKSCGYNAMARTYATELLRVGLADLDLHYIATAHALLATIYWEAGDFDNAHNELADCIHYLSSASYCPTNHFAEAVLIASTLGVDIDLSAVELQIVRAQTVGQLYSYLVDLQRLGRVRRMRDIVRFTGLDEGKGNSVEDICNLIGILDRELRSASETQGAWGVLISEFRLCKVDSLFLLKERRKLTVRELIEETGVSELLAAANGSLEELQARRSLVDGLLLEARLHFEDGWFAWACEAAGFAECVAARIGYSRGRAEADWIFRECERRAEIPEEAVELRKVARRVLDAASEATQAHLAMS